MKKLLTISVLFVMMLAMCTSMVSATTSAQLPDALMGICERFGATAADKIKLERYLADNPMTEAEANAIVAKANEAAAYMDSIGATNVNQLTAAQKDHVKTIANQAASVVGVTLSFSNSDVKAYKNGKLIDVTPVAAPAGSSSAPAATSSAAKLVYTGSNGYIALAIGGAVVALATILVVRKKVVNA